MTGKLAWKNIWRNKTRSIIFISAALLGIALAILALNLMKSISDQRLDDAISIQTGHIQIHRSGFTDDKDVNLFIDDVKCIITKLDSIEDIKAISKRIVVDGMIASPENSFVAEIKGIIPQEERKLSVLNHHLVEGTWFGGEVKAPALISTFIADKLNLQLHSKFIITLKNASGEIEGGAFRVAGIFKTPNTPFDESNLLVRFDDLSLLTGVRRPHEIALRLTNTEESNKTRQQVEKALGDQYQISEWKTLLPDLYAFSGFTDMVSMLFTVIILLGLAFGLVNTMNMIVQERKREIGMLRALGQSQVASFSMLMKEAGLMMFIGSVAGILLGIVIVHIAGAIGISLGDGFGTLGIRYRIYPEMHWGQLIMMSMLATVLTLIISAIPASKVFSIDPSSALKE